jgi:hypothetical protein
MHELVSYLLPIIHQPNTIMTSVRVAFKKNSVNSALENLICLCSLDRHVHAEIRFYGYTFSSFYDSPNPIDVMLECNEGEWDFQEIPLTHPDIALDILEGMFRQCRASYGFNPLDMALPKSCLDFWEDDLDCTRPDEWRRIFCSQLVLLFLRRCALAGVLQGNLDLLWSVNTHGCTPAMLRTLLGRVF